MQAQWERGVLSTFRAETAYLVTQTHSVRQLVWHLSGALQEDGWCLEKVAELYLDLPLMDK